MVIGVSTYKKQRKDCNYIQKYTHAHGRSTFLTATNHLKGIFYLCEAAHNSPTPRSQTILGREIKKSWETDVLLGKFQRKRCKRLHRIYCTLLNSFEGLTCKSVVSHPWKSPCFFGKKGAWEPCKKASMKRLKNVPQVVKHYTCFLTLYLLYWQNIYPIHKTSWSYVYITVTKPKSSQSEYRTFLKAEWKYSVFEIITCRILYSLSHPNVLQRTSPDFLRRGILPLYDFPAISRVLISKKRWNLKQPFINVCFN